MSSKPKIVTPIIEALWTPEEVAEYLNVELSTVLRMAREGDIPAVKVGRLWRFRGETIREAFRPRFQGRE
ncbi:MAG: helix-turn-helix domain-containing protein [Salinivirgaceae bacterium]|nr:helix-turn-helix domain-containing protein [Salinivirgaceae bacterium]